MVSFKSDEIFILGNKITIAGSTSVVLLHKAQQLFKVIITIKSVRWSGNVNVNESCAGGNLRRSEGLYSVTA